MFKKNLLLFLALFVFCGMASGGTGKRRVVADFDGDGKTDISLFRPSTAEWHIWRSSDNAHQVTRFGRSPEVIAPGDYDGDKKTDIAVFRNGVWYILNSSDHTVRYEYFGWGNERPAVGDYDGDGKDDLGLFHGETGTWHIQRSTDRLYYQVRFGLWDRPVPADYDGDGKTDIAVWRGTNDPNAPDFYILNSSDFSVSMYSWGLDSVSDTPAIGDYDGDGKADIAVCRYFPGIWYILKSTGGYSVESFLTNTPFAAPGDYDGDGKTDVATYDPAGHWDIKNSSTGESRIQNFGIVEDWAIPYLQAP